MLSDDSEQSEQEEIQEDLVERHSQQRDKTSNRDIAYTYFFGVELTGDSPTYVWSEGRDSEQQTAYEDSPLEGELTEESYIVSQVLGLRQVALGADAKPGERNVLELWSRTREDEPVNYSIAVLTCGKREMECLHLNFRNIVPVALRLSAGSGPLVVTGQLERRFTFDPDYSPNDTATESTSSDESYEEINPDEEVKQKEYVVDEVEMQKELLWQKFLKNRIVFAAETGRCSGTGETSSAVRGTGARQHPRFKEGYAVRSRQHPSQKPRRKELTEQNREKSSDTLSSPAARRINL